ncbi:MAG TPA: T9SS type A sorting domain-containing protein [Candidatus Cloacimonadota bacterium]|nr:T9SS type A sorting domain-containing protein [Candidatus Cloacimonadota bacterium]
MRKFMVTLIFLALMCAGAYAANLTIRAFDVVTSAELDWNLGTGAEIYFNGFPTGHQTPHVFVNYPSGDYSVQRTGYIDWLPVAVTFNATSANVSFSFYGVPTVFTPVTLNSFTSTYDANAQGVKLTWVSQSEIIMLGYRLYRSETPVQADAVLITPTMIEASNSSDVTIYQHTDVEIEAGHTYYYWLESVDMVGSQFFNPVTIRIEDHSTETPIITPSLSGGPNPFKAGTSTNLYYSVKAGETGTLTVYNILGQVVKTHQVTEGSNQLIKWDGRDSKGNVCASGVYFYKLSTPSLNETRKLVIVD